MGNKKTGSFYTPDKLVRYMVDWAVKKHNFNSVLEPSAGDGRFVRELIPYGKSVTALELMPRKCRAIRKKYSEVTAISDDFVRFCMNTNEKFDLVIGNPPYISKRELSEKLRRRSKKLVDFFGLDESYFQNLWVSFILGALKLLNERGAILYVLPYEFLQVQYAEKLRAFLEKKFNTIEIVTFKEKVFPDIEQDVCLVFMRNARDSQPVVSYETIDSLDNLSLVFQSSVIRNKPLKKWSNCIIDDDETDFLKKLCSSHPLINSFGDISPGIVTGANGFFILDSEEVKAYDAADFVLPIIQKSQDIGNRIVFDLHDHEESAYRGSRAYLLNTNGVRSDDFSAKLKGYLSQGEKAGIPNRYKCSKRDRWHDVPIVKAGEVSFFKRYGNFPRIIVNVDKIHTTDSAYNVRLSEFYDPYSFVLSFYNSLTLTMCEYNGRFYGGGVCELVPSEFKALPLPYVDASRDEVIKLDKLLKSNASFSNVVDFVDSIVLSLPEEELKRLQIIRNRYINRRLKK